jgi:quinohemoprotein amine dehydrogenase
MSTVRNLAIQTLFLVTVGAGIVRAQDSAGIPINDELTIQKCGGCHRRDQNGIMRRISSIRTSPEVWEQAMKRMVRLNGLVLKPEEARSILKYLTKNNGLSPEEEKLAFWEAEHRMFRDQSDLVPSPDLQHTCNYCHTIGRVLTQRRTREDYVKLANMHMGLFPGAENVLRPRRQRGPDVEAPIRLAPPGPGMPAIESAGPPPAPNAARNDGRYPMDIAIDYLVKNQPLITPEWTAWAAAMKTPKLDGKWALTGYQVGKGRIFGTLTIEPGAAPDEFNTKVEIEYVSTGKTLTRTGKSVVYTGFSWRGRSTMTAAPEAASDPNFPPAEWREAMMVSRDTNNMDGRWFWGGYQEFGIDVHLRRINSEPILSGINISSLKSPSTGEVKLYGANIPADLKPADVDLGTGVTIRRIVSRTATSVTVDVAVADKVPTAMHDASLARSSVPKAFAVYDQVAYIKVTPDADMARLGGGIAAKQYAQFETIAYAKGPDGKANTADDISLGPVAAKYNMEEFLSTPDDDDAKFVGNLNPNTGLFTPSIEGPNPERKKASNNLPTNNWGDVWVSATYTVGGQELKSRAYLVVTIPVYVKYDQAEVGQ